jgi:hypothetical protein
MYFLQRFRVFFKMLLLKKNYLLAEQFKHSNRFRSLNVRKELLYLLLESYNVMCAIGVCYVRCLSMFSVRFLTFTSISLKSHTLKISVSLIIFLLTKDNTKLRKLKE